MKIKHLFIGLAAILVVGLGYRGAYAVLDYVEGMMIPSTLKADYQFSGGHYDTPVTKTTAFTPSVSVNRYDLDSTAGAFLVSLPASGTTGLADGKCWDFVLQVANGAASFSPSAVGDLLDASQAAYAGVDAVGDAVTICYDSGTTNYSFQSRYIH